MNRKKEKCKKAGNTTINGLKIKHYSSPDGAVSHNTPYLRPDGGALF